MLTDADEPAEQPETHADPLVDAPDRAVPGGARCGAPSEQAADPKADGTPAEPAPAPAAPADEPTGQ